MEQSIDSQQSQFDGLLQHETNVQFDCEMETATYKYISVIVHEMETIRKDNLLSLKTDNRLIAEFLPMEDYLCFCMGHFCLDILVVLL